MGTACCLLPPTKYPCFSPSSVLYCTYRLPPGPSTQRKEHFMKQFFQDVIVQQLISFEYLIKFTKFFLPFAVSYIMGRYTSNNPRRKAINQEQLEHVYLPLYKLLFAQDISTFDHQKMIKLSNRIQSILFNNYELAFPQLHQLSTDLQQALLLNKNYRTIICQIKYQVDIDYESLKRKLGYPHLNAYELFKRKTLIDKVRTIWGYVLVLYLFPGAFIIASITSSSWRPLFLYFIGFCFVVRIGVKLGTQNTSHFSPSSTLQ